MRTTEFDRTVLEKEDRTLPSKPAPSAAAVHRRRLSIALALIVGLLIVELTVAWLTGSLTLFSDAGHLATDVVGLGLALGAVSVAASRPPTTRTSFGWYRLEILAALANALLLVGVAVAVLISVIRRWSDPHPIEPGPLLIVATIALAINLACAWLLREGAEDSLNLQGARLEVLADAIGSVGVLITAVVIHLTGWVRIDSIIALAIVVWILPRALRLGGKAVRILLQQAPDHLDVEELEGQIRALPKVSNVHALHIWTLTSGMPVASLHIEVADPADQHEARHLVHDLIRAQARIDHVTIQVDLLDDPDCCPGRSMSPRNPEPQHTPAPR